MAGFDLKNVEPRLLKKTLDLVQLYNTNRVFRGTFDKHVGNRWTTFRGLPLKTYVKILTTTPRYKRYYNEIKKNSEATKELFLNFYKDPLGFAKLHRDFTVNQFASGLNQGELALVKQIEEAPQKSDEHKKLVEKLHDKHSGKSFAASIKQVFVKEKEEGQILELEEQLTEKSAEPSIHPTPPTSPISQQGTVTPVYQPKFQVPSFAKDIGPGARILARKILVKLAPNIFSGTIGGLVGGAFFGAPGGVVGAAAGAIFPNALKNSALRGLVGGGVKAAVGGGTKAATAASGAALGPVGLAATMGVTLATSKTARNVVIGIVGGLFILPILFGLNKQLTFFSPANVAETAPLPPDASPGPIVQPSSDISACKFVRGDHNPKGASYNSPLLLSYFQEASNLTGIPPALLAAFMRVESPGLTSMNDDGILGYRCAQSPTGALGVMQIQPPGSTSENGDSASCDDCIDAGARLIGKTVGTLTRDDYCNVRKSIIIGSGFILKKMSYTGYTYGNGQRWDPAWTQDRAATNALVKGYYGCLPYGGPGCTGQYNYGDDVWNSLQNCQPSTPVPPPSRIANSCPIPDGVATCGSINTSRGGCSHCGVGYEPYTATYCPPPWGKANWDGNQSALDIGSKNGQDFYLPMIDGKVIRWTHVSESNGANGQIQKYIGTDVDKNTYLLYFHHTQNGSGNTKGGISGDFAGKICLYCNINNVHLHVQIADGNSNWLDSAQYFCK